jgi:hypothetical protein
MESLEYYLPTCAKGYMKDIHDFSNMHMYQCEGTVRLDAYFGGGVRDDEGREDVGDKYKVKLSILLHTLSRSSCLP